MTKDTFETLLNAALQNTPRADNQLLERASLSRMVRTLSIGGRIDGADKELHQETARQNGRHQDETSGAFLPFEMLVPKRRDMSVSVFNQGGATVATQVSPDPIEVLLNRATAFRLGVRKMPGLKSSLAIPRVTAPPAVQALAESATATKSNVNFDQVLLSPKRLTATVDVTRQLIVQSSVSMEDFVRGLLGDMLMLATDKAIYTGQGASSEPQGILNTPGISTVTFGGAASFAKMVDFETALAAANADVLGARLAYVTTPAVRARLKTAAKIPTGGAAIYPSFLWEPGNFGDDSGDGLVNGIRAACTNQVPNNQVIFGNFADAVVGIFGTPEIIVNPYSRDTDAAVRITLHMFLDVAIRHPQSFCVSGDAGNQ